LDPARRAVCAKKARQKRFPRPSLSNEILFAKKKRAKKETKRKETGLKTCGENNNASVHAVKGGSDKTGSKRYRAGWKKEGRGGH